MRVLIFSTAFLPLVGGAELAIKEITDRLPDHSFTLITACFSRAVSHRERIGNVEVHRVGLGFFFDKWLLPFLGSSLGRKLHREQAFDVAWSMMASQASVAAAWFKNCFPEVKLVLTLQEGDEEEHLKRYVFGIDLLYRSLVRPWHALVFKRANVVTAISKYLLNRARKINPDVPIHLVPNGVDVSKFKVESSKLKVAELRQRLGYTERDRVIVTASRLVKKNGVGDLIEAMNYLPEHIKLLVVGSGPLLSSLKLNVEGFKLGDRIKFSGEIAHEKLPQYLWASDIFCRPSLSEGFGSAFVEAMAAGLPVVATPVGGIVDFLNDNETGLFCEINNPQSIARKVEALLEDEELRKRLVENASRMAREKYEWNGIAALMEDVFVDKK